MPPSVCCLNYPNDFFIGVVLTADKEKFGTAVRKKFTHQKTLNIMKKSGLFLSGILLCAGLFSQEVSTKHYWTAGTAYTVARHRCELGLMSESRFGLTDQLELSTSPLLFLVAPQLKLKKNWGTYGGFEMATEHGVFCPTPFMSLVAREGTGGLISSEFAIPGMFAIDNRLLVSRKAFRQSLLSAHAGITFALKMDNLDERTTIDLPVLYPRLAAFYDSPALDLGVDFQGNFSPRFGYMVKVENFILPTADEYYFLENKGALYFMSEKQSIRLQAGYKLCYGQYPFGTQWHLLPVLDLGVGFGG